MARRQHTTSNSYDKVIKENLEAVLLPLTELLLGIRIQKSEKLTVKLQTTLEREPDFIRTVETPLGERFILHLEFQSSDEAHMVYRMKEYEAILSRKFRIPIRQFVVYLGDKLPKMRTQLAKKEVFQGFELVNLSALDSEKLLKTEVPEAILLAVLAAFEKEKSWEVLTRIYHQIRKLSADETQLRKYLKQLEVLSRLRNLEEQTIKLIQEMPITYDITQDYAYKQGMEKEKFRIVQNWLQSQAFLSAALTYEDIASSCGLTTDQVKEIHRKLSRNSE